MFIIIIIWSLFLCAAACAGVCAATRGKTRVLGSSGGRKPQYNIDLPPTQLLK